MMITTIVVSGAKENKRRRRLVDASMDCPHPIKAHKDNMVRDELEVVSSLGIAKGNKEVGLESMSETGVSKTEASLNDVFGRDVGEMKWDGKLGAYVVCDSDVSIAISPEAVYRGIDKDYIIDVILAQPQEANPWLSEEEIEAFRLKNEEEEEEAVDGKARGEGGGGQRQRQLSVNCGPSKDTLATQFYVQKSIVPQKVDEAMAWFKKGTNNHQCLLAHSNGIHFFGKIDTINPNYFGLFLAFYDHHQSGERRMEHQRAIGGGSGDTVFTYPEGAYSVINLNGAISVTQGNNQIDKIIISQTSLAITELSI